MAKITPHDRKSSVDASRGELVQPTKASDDTNCPALRSYYGDRFIPAGMHAQGAIGMDACRMLTQRIKAFGSFRPIFQSADPFLPAPVSIYRMQLTPSFTFDDVIEQLDRLQSRGIHTIYLSPITTPQKGSTHGYNVVDYDRINPEVGGEAGFQKLVEHLAQRRMGLIIDFVPNHMGIERGENAWWQDVLRWGERSAYANHFDIQWDEGAGRINLYFLGAPFEELAAAGQAQLVDREGEGLSLVCYGVNPYPVAPESLVVVLDAIIKRGLLGSSKRAVIEQARSLRSRLDAVDVNAGLKGSAAALERECMHFLGKIGMDRVLEKLNADPTFLKRLHEKQHYRLDYWRRIDGLNYARFFAIKELARVRVESKPVFNAVHAGVLRWTKMLSDRGVPVAWRIDHPDGLDNPTQYFQWISQALELERGAGTVILAEKILGVDEQLPASWVRSGVMGTTGYDFIKQMNDLSIDRGGMEAIHSDFERFLGETPKSFSELLYESNLTVMHSPFELHPEFDRCRRKLLEVFKASETQTCMQLAEALTEVMAHFPVYRTYTPRSGKVSAIDRRHIDTACDAAIAHCKELKPEIERLRALLLDPRAVAGGIEFVMLFQRLTGPLKAKGFEDTALYRNVVIGTLNEVGGEPMTLGSVHGYHEAMERRSRILPYSIATQSTHDTKRGIDARMRISALTHMSQDWSAWMGKMWSQNERHLDAVSPLQKSDAWLLFQTMVAAYPSEFLGGKAPSVDQVQAYRKRIEAYMMKALREAKERTFWVKPDAADGKTPEEQARLARLGKECEAYEQGVSRYIEAIFQDPAFLKELHAFSASVAEVAMPLSLGQVALQLTAPGVPDVYQGGFAWNTSLVDPDNRRPVDYADIEALWESTQVSLEKANDSAKRAALYQEMMTHWTDGRIKMAIMSTLLQERNGDPEAFVEGPYVPLTLDGVKAEEAIAYQRVGKKRHISVVFLHPNIESRPMVVEGLEPNDVYEDVFTGLEFQVDHQGSLDLLGLPQMMPVIQLRQL